MIRYLWKQLDVHAQNRQSSLCRTMRNQHKSWSLEKQASSLQQVLLDLEGYDEKSKLNPCLQGRHRLTGNRQRLSSKGDEVDQVGEKCRGNNLEEIGWGPPTSKGNFLGSRKVLELDEGKF